MLLWKSETGFKRDCDELFNDILNYKIAVCENLRPGLNGIVTFLLGPSNKPTYKRENLRPGLNGIVTLEILNSFVSGLNKVKIWDRV